jgi:beta-N-acetylhexosaminidase
MSALRFQTLSESQKAGQLLLVGIHGTELDSELRSRIQAVSPGGIILFTRNLVDAQQVSRLCRDLFDCLPTPPFLAIDQEGGRVNRLLGIFPPIPPNLTLAGDPGAGERVRLHARETGRGLRALGFNLNFAPVLDLSEAEDPNGIGDRAYGSDPKTVSELARIFLESQDGALACGKHFPGLGGGKVDSHLSLPIITRDAERLWESDLIPYRRLKDRLAMVMVGHAYYPSLQGKTPVPATLSERVVHRILRERIGFRGVVLTDDLEMGAIEQQRGAGEVVLEALAAGNDLVMYCKSWEKVEEAHFALVKALRSGRLREARVDQSLSRILALKESLPPRGGLPAFDPELLSQAREGLIRLGEGRA